MSTLPIVGIIGRAGSGKSTLAKILVKEFDYIEFAVADPLKMIVRDMFDIDENVLWGPSEAKDAEVRKMLQEIGTDYGRRYRPGVWAEKLRRRIVRFLDKQDDYLGLYTVWETRARKGVVVSDVRFPNEADVIRGMGGYLVKIVKPEVRICTAVQEHESETVLESITYHRTVINNGTIADLEKEVRECIAPILERKEYQ